MGGIQKHTSLKSTRHKPNSKHVGVHKDSNIQPGDIISTEQFVCTLKGRLAYMRGKEDPHKMLSGGAIFVDHASGYVRVYN